MGLWTAHTGKLQFRCKAKKWTSEDILKEDAFIAGKSENQAAKKKIIRFFIDILIANISLYALSWPKLNFGCYLTFEIIF